jgi:hypothetical protein
VARGELVRHLVMDVDRAGRTGELGRLVTICRNVRIRLIVRLTSPSARISSTDCQLAARACTGALLDLLLQAGIGFPSASHVLNWWQGLELVAGPDGDALGEVARANPRGATAPDRATVARKTPKTQNRAASSTGEPLQRV